MIIYNNYHSLTRLFEPGQKLSINLNLSPHYLCLSEFQELYCFYITHGKVAILLVEVFNWNFDKERILCKPAPTFKRTLKDGLENYSKNIV